MYLFNAFTRKLPFLVPNCLFLFFLLGSLELQAQLCNPLSITLGTQAEVDGFQATYGTCTEVVGTLTIEGNAITNLNGLTDLSSVGSLIIRNCPALTDISGLANLGEIKAGGRLVIEAATAITSLNWPGLQMSSLSEFRIEQNNSLLSIDLPQFAAFDGQTCQVVGNDVLHTLALSGLTTVNATNGVGLQTSYNSSLTTLDLSSLHTSNGLWVQDQALASITGNSLQTLTGGGLTLRTLPNLSSGDFFSNLTTFNGFRVYLEDVPLLPDMLQYLNGVGNSITTNGWLIIENADAITELDWPDLSMPSLSQFRIEQNNSLLSVDLPQFTAFDGQTCQVVGNDVLHTLALSGLTTVNATNGVGLQTSYNSSLITLDLSSLHTSNGLWVQDQALASITGNSLQTLTGGGLVLRTLPNLSNSDFFSNLTTFNGFRLLLEDVPLLPDLLQYLNGVGNSITTGGQLIIENAHAITELNWPHVSIPSLSQFRIEINNSLLSVNLPQFVAFDGQTCHVVTNDVLHTLNLSGLTTVNATNGRGLQTSFNPNLINLDLTSFHTSNGLWIEDNELLSNLNGFPNLITLDGDLYVFDNPMLCDCSTLSPLLNTIDDNPVGPGAGPDGFPDVSGTIVITGNLPGCNTIAEIQSGATQMTCYLDADGDTFGDAENSAAFCETCGAGYVLNDTDCDDADPNQNPGITEVCDGIDNNCDGNIDEGFDQDGDGICDSEDNCPQTSNSDQADADQDGQGDACDSCPLDAGNDFDGDGVCSDIDNCPDVVNGNQLDSDGDGIGDACDICPIADPNNDADQDGICGNEDNCPVIANGDQLDADGDGIGDVCDVCPFDPFNDIDGDGVCGEVDNCPFTANPDQMDSDADGEGDVCDDSFDDLDEDGVPDVQDNCPDHPNADQTDSDCDTVGDVCDQCPGGDDRIDTYGDPTVPDCAEYIDYNSLPAEFKCGNNKVLVCHVPQGNPSNAHNICISKNAVENRLLRGDYLGNCHEVECTPGAFHSTPGIPVNVDQEGQVLELILFPNPATNEVSFTVKGNSEVLPYQYDIFNQMGQRVFEGKVAVGSNDVQAINLAANGLLGGSYILVVEIAGTKLYSKFIVLD